uniref:CREG-like beta-barrel domain-containing protein n=1 Tax=Florenciella parvula TaxID=236787 RepID=A0A7S2CWJ1_9STRA|mmetsp:Transcript_5805/g.11813  ORF Transcript_5805/g.11813 Transcript_5805/m.11813 type:complete len:191 (+) Transcript_5805:1-573(+)
MRAVILALALSLVGSAVASRDDKAAYARSMVSSLDWGVMSTISTASDTAGAPFGNPQSHAEVDGNIYYYVSDVDQSMLDIAVNNQVGYTLSNAEALSSPACGSIPYAGDEESPLCSRLSITGNFVNISGTDEEEQATDALFKAHPAMKNWPADHSWFVGKLEITQLWEINMFGGASHITPAQYYAGTDAN